MDGARGAGEDPRTEGTAGGEPEWVWTLPQVPHTHLPSGRSLPASSWPRALPTFPRAAEFLSVGVGASWAALTWTSQEREHAWVPAGH